MPFKILVVDDETLSRNMITTILSLIGKFSGKATIEVVIHAAAAGSEAVTLVSEGLRPDLVITDKVMPDLTGYQVIARIRELMKGEVQPKYMVLSAMAAEPTEVEYDLYMEKPFQPRELCSNIVELCPTIIAN